MQHLVITNNIVFNNLIETVHKGKPQDLRLAKNCYVYVRLTNGEDQDFSEFDLAVLSCLHAIWQDPENPDNAFSITGICRMLGYSNKGGLSQTAQMAVAASIARLESITLQINAKKDFEPHRRDFIAANNLAELASSSWDEITNVQWDNSNPLIEVNRSLSRIPRGSTQITAVAYTLIREPLLHLYSRITRQFVTIDGRYMHPVNLDDDGALTESSISMTPTRIGMTFWCARQCERLRYAASHQTNGKTGKPSANKLLLSTIFERAGLEKREASKHKGRYIEFLSQVLSCWAAWDLVPAWHFSNGLFNSPNALILDFGSAASPQNTHVCTPAEVGNIGVNTSTAPTTDTTIGAVDTIIGALHTIIGAMSTSIRTARNCVQSHFRRILDELEELRMYCKYSTELPPAVPSGAGGAKLSL